MERNVGGLDRKARLVAGPILLVLGIALAARVVGTISLVVAGLAIVVGAVLLVTGTIQKCPANSIVGINTCDRPDR